MLFGVIGMLDKLKIACEVLSLRNSAILVAVSGGPDSVALLDGLTRLKREFSFSLAIGHFNHVQRKESDEEESFVVSLGRRYNVPTYVGRLDAPLKEGVGKEAAMREERYNFLIETAKREGYPFIALAHHMDDQAETVILNLLRGAGIQGLKGMMLKTVRDGVVLVRPLLEVNRKEIEDYIEHNKLEFRIDRSNYSSEFLRNKIRWELIPYLEGDFNPKIKERLSILAKVLGEEFDFISSLAQKQLEGLIIYESIDELMIGLSFLDLHEALRRQVFRLAIKRLRSDLRQIDFRHYQEFVKMLKDWPIGSVLDLPLGLSVEKRRRGIRFFLRKEKKEDKKDEK